MSIGVGRGEKRALDAVTQAINSRLLDVSIDGAKGLLFNIKGGEDLALFEVNDAAEIMRQMVDPEANIIFGATIDESLNDEVQITIVATGFDGHSASQGASRDVASRPARASKTIEFPIKDLHKDDRDIPAFLRR